MDWKLLIADLKAWGYTQPQIAAECSRGRDKPFGQSTINELATGTTTQPRYDLGRALEDLHKRARRKAEKAGAN